MNEQSMDTLTTNRPTKRQTYARLLAATCMVNYPSVRRPNMGYVWAETALYCAHNRDFGQWALQAGIGGLRRFVGIVYDVWGYWLNR